MIVDLVRDGPHGLVGGTSGSGKTEFLKTLFCGLALNNHPDDLSIVIVDFKGGVDHEAVKPLPHVIDVATNLDIEQFKRTIVLLKAESMRRQDLLASAGASNVDSYRLARANKPELPALPRLLVVVDEFGELLASEGGREQLKELESITRIGRALGLHLLLVTQNFDGNLPAQIDANAGMRVCLRVQKPAHSKAVLDSGVAATIADRNVGRAYARFHGRELIEFQTARVAGRRRDLAGSTTPLTARLVPFSLLSAAPPESRPEDVPVEETDMYVILQSIRAAARGHRLGAQRGAVAVEPARADQPARRSAGARPTASRRSASATCPSTSAAGCARSASATSRWRCSAGRARRCRRSSPRTPRRWPSAARPTTCTSTASTSSGAACRSSPTCRTAAASPCATTTSPCGCCAGSPSSSPSARPRWPRRAARRCGSTRRSPVSCRRRSCCSSAAPTAC